MIDLLVSFRFPRWRKMAHSGAPVGLRRPVTVQPPTETRQRPCAPLRPSESFCWVCGRPEVSFCPEKCLAPICRGDGTIATFAAPAPLDAAEEAADARAAAGLDAEVAV